MWSCSNVRGGLAPARPPLSPPLAAGYAGRARGRRALTDCQAQMDSRDPQILARSLCKTPTPITSTLLEIGKWVMP